MWWRKTYRGRITLIITPGKQSEGGLTLDIEDLSKFLYNVSSDGWLNRIVIEAALRVIILGAHPERIPFII